MISRQAPHPWFHVREVAPRTWLIAEPGHVNSWLLSGDDRAVLVDTGLGICPIRPVAEALTGKPVSVVNTHAHVDHVLGNAEFDEIAIHELGAAGLEEGPPAELLAEYMDYARRMIAATGEQLALDRRFFHVVNDESAPRPFPAGFDPASFAFRPSRATHLLHDGDLIELGGRTLRVIHTPGHSPDGICLLDDREGVLVAGDTVNSGPHYVHFPGTSLEDFAASTARLAALRDDVSLVLMAHWGRTVAEPAFLAEVADGAARALAGDVALDDDRDLHDNPVKAARFPRFSIFLPA
ncbi:MAG TPA: MBL fold metallo-hydrolase [Conexibacter sp.]|nr:MBL fold metallo-hydrolase [Conexibacter sp.]